METLLTFIRANLVNISGEVAITGTGREARTI